MSDNLKKYRLGIINTIRQSTYVMDAIPLLIGCLGALIPFLPSKWTKDIISICYIAIFIILATFYYIIKNNVENLRADNKYLDEEILLLKEYGYELEDLKRNLHFNFRRVLQITYFTAALDYTIKEFSELLYKKSDEFIDFKISLNKIFNDIYKTIKIGYKDYQENITLALYYHCEETNQYLDFCSCKPDISNTKKGRIWDVTDDAHICYVARHKERNEFVYNNINKELPTPKNSAYGDDDEYKASVSIPIFYKDKNSIRAILSITSNYEDRFNKNSSSDKYNNVLNTIFIRVFYSIAKLIEIILNTKYPNDSTDIILDILLEYQYSRPECLTPDLKKLLDNLRNNKQKLLK